MASCTVASCRIPMAMKPGRAALAIFSPGASIVSSRQSITHRARRAASIYTRCWNARQPACSRARRACWHWIGGMGTVPPWWMSISRVCCLGMTLATSAPEIYRALIEATAYGTRKIIEAFEQQRHPYP